MEVSWDGTEIIRAELERAVVRMVQQLHNYT